MGTSALLGLGAQLAITILQRSTKKEDRKYIDEYVEAEKALLAERSKPLADQFDNVIENYEGKLAILFEAAKRQAEVASK
jgi:hypothetical protein